jgi:lipid-A-disaccharide synthase-like uncharacterized protein
VEEWRSFLYPLGFISAFLFGIRFVIQWIESEKAHDSIASASFWHLSLTGNFLLMIHSFIQIQYPICLVQSCHAVISWRNLNLLPTNKTPYSFSTVIFLFIIAIFSTSFAFVIQDNIMGTKMDWFRVPQAPWQTSLPSVSFLWHIIGTFGYLVFSSRFWVQWWLVEKSQVSQLPPIFWYLSLLGAILSIVYFIRIEDSVNLIGPLLGLIPYIRNLMLLYKRRNAIS